MGTWAVQATATRATVTSVISLRGIPARLRELAGVMAAQMLGDDDDEPTLPAAEPDDSYPYYLSKHRPTPDVDRADSEPEATDPEPGQAGDDTSAEPRAAEPAPSGTQKQRHTPRHAAPSPTLAAKLSSAKPRLPGFAPKSSHAGW